MQKRLKMKGFAPLTPPKGPLVNPPVSFPLILGAAC
jgi:hypothetical protein